ncbi:ATP-binding cassette domain-containing protein [Streptomyces sp. MS2A]|nr:ATP-binding cassette domain-containing protein [Streptomyces sp. MS2A]
MSTEIRLVGLRKSFGDVVAVADVGFVARPGRVTGLLGPNGAGKSTTLRMLLGLTRPDAGSATISGHAYRDLVAPARTVGAVLDIAGAHPRMTARAHLRTLCALGGLPRARVDAVLGAVGAEQYADRRVGGFSTGMRQRLALAAALLGEPEALVLDEPANGLDPAGVAWLRGVLRDFAARGGTVLVSSHLLGEIQQSADDVVLLDQGAVAWAGPIADLVSDGETLESAFLRLTGAEVAA